MNVVIQLFLYDFSKCKNDYEKMRKEIRVKEFAAVLRMNLANPHIKSVHSLCETQEAADYFSAVANELSHKAVFTVIGHQPTYKELVDYVKETFQTREIVCIMNGDIFFNSEKDHLLIEKHLQPNHLFSLTRHEITDTGHQTHTAESCPFTVNGGSSDTFIFYTPLPDTLDTTKMDFRQNLFGAEAVFMKPWADAGYEIWNPCDDILTLHLHQDRIHFERYATIDNPTNAVYNPKTPLPPIPSHKDT
jgi:hypothetical protein